MLRWAWLVLLAVALTTGAVPAQATVGGVDVLFEASLPTERGDAGLGIPAEDSVATPAAAHGDAVNVTLEDDAQASIVAVSVHGDSEGLVAVSGTGDARGGNLGISGDGNASCDSNQCVTASGTQRSECRDSSGNACVAVAGPGGTAGCPGRYLVCVAEALPGLGPEGPPVNVTPQGDAEADLAAVSGTGSSEGFVAASSEGNARSTEFCPTSESIVCPRGIAVSGQGDAVGIAAASATGNATSGCWLTSPVCGGAVTGTGDAHGHKVALSGTGDARAHLVAVSGDGNAEGPIAVSPLGSANGSLLGVDGEERCGEQRCVDAHPTNDTDAALIAASGTGNSSSGLVAVSGAGDAQHDARGSGVVASGTGNASGGSLSVSGSGDANGTVPISLAGTCHRGQHEARDCFAVEPFDDAEGTYVGVSGTDNASGQVALAPFGNARAIERTVLLPGLAAASGTGDARGLAAVSATGNASSRCIQFIVCGAAATGTGDARGFVAATLTGNASDRCRLVGCGVATSGTGDASSRVAVSGTGDADGALAAAGTGDAEGLVAASGTGDAQGIVAMTPAGNATGECFGPACGPAVSGTGNASTQCQFFATKICGPAVTALGDAEGSPAVSLAGDSQGETAAVSGTGDAEADLVAASGPGDAHANAATVSLGGESGNALVSLSPCKASGLVAPPEHGLFCWSLEEDESGGFVSASVLGNAQAATVCLPIVDWVCVQGVAVSGTGSADGLAAASGTGSADGFWVAASGTGPARANIPVSVLGTCNGQDCYRANATGPADAFWIAVSGTHKADGIVAASLLGNAEGSVAVAPIGDAEGGIAVAPLGSADGFVPVGVLGTCNGRKCVDASPGGANGYWLAVSPDGAATSSEGVAVSGTGGANGGLVAASVLGESAAPVGVTVAGEASGGYLDCISIVLCVPGAGVSVVGPAQGPIAVSGTCEAKGFVTVSPGGVKVSGIPGAPYVQEGTPVPPVCFRDLPT